MFSRLAGRLKLSRLIGRLKKSVAATAIAGVAGLSVVAAIGWGVADADDDELVGRAISDAHLAAINEAALSCPMLTPTRIAGQLMAESGLNEKAKRTVSGGRGIAGLDDADWKRWAPWQKAARTDPAANILALAHQMCHFSGELRLTTMRGDHWQLSLAAYRSGMKAVESAGGVPKPAADYVKKADAYAAYYEKLPHIGSDKPAAPDEKPDDTKPIPDEYVEPLVKAGTKCPQVSSAAVAGQIMALSGFNGDKLGSRGEQGIAQFRPDIWKRFAPGGTSPWDAKVAIPVVGTALCGLVTEFSGLPGDPYLLAVSAFTSGPTTVRQAGGKPQASATGFLERVAAYTAYYKLDTRLTGAPNAAPPAGKPTASNPVAVPSGAAPPPPPEAQAQAQANPPKGKDTPKSKTTTKAAQPQSQPDTPLPGVTFVQKMSGKCLDAGAGVDGTKLTMQSCSNASSQRWDVRDDGTIRSILTGLCMDVAMADTAQGTPVQTANCSGNPAQQWSINNNMVKTGLTNNCIDSVGDSKANGTKIEMVGCQGAGHSQQTWNRKK
ncbi:ricin-type beta-trefoil lectin domain protein [Jidongwangia harbinensis]|uniref:ricin-type beta-trefoil lectin domain protein n=1 Tax=Jidongwangia harbinensis TaxID=2878561 RepID=UPI001CD9ECEF|nr:ricin-type beta-trefoil lectin domain protein [Jidongwangia harbinensis]MCA2213387.1 ricin-type beta-trefoil lectin domain protein [Jidongwangia harbinensis]